jgi:hypothetical protein
MAEQVTPAIAWAAAMAAATSDCNARSHISLITTTVVLSTPSPEPPPALPEDNPERKGTENDLVQSGVLAHGGLRTQGVM